MSKTQARQTRRHTQGKQTSWLPLALIAAGVVVLGAVLWAALVGRPGASKVPIEVTGTPRLKADQQRVDLGNLALGQTVEVSFQLANIGDQPLRFAEAPYITVVEGC